MSPVESGTPSAPWHRIGYVGRYRKQACRGVVVLIVALAAAIGVTRPAVAHSGKGTISIASAEMTGPLTIRYQVVITFNGDGHLAPSAVATVVAEADGLRVGPVPLAAVPGSKGTYEATVQFPSSGVWQTRFSALDPTAFLERTETVTEPTTTTVLPTTVPPTVPETAPSTVPAVPVSDSAPAETSTVVSEVAESVVAADTTAALKPSPTVGQPDRSRGAGSLIVIGGIALVVIAGAGFIRYRRSRSGRDA